jgi:hypothetical protein
LQNEILRDATAPLIRHTPAHERFTFVHARRDRFSLKQLCQVLLTDRAHHRAWTKAATSRAAREAEEQRLTRMIIETPPHTPPTAPSASPATSNAKEQTPADAEWHG